MRAGWPPPRTPGTLRWLAPAAAAVLCLAAQGLIRAL